MEDIPKQGGLPLPPLPLGLPLPLLPPSTNSQAYPPAQCPPLCVAVCRSMLSCAVRASGGGVDSPPSLLGLWQLQCANENLVLLVYLCECQCVRPVTVDARYIFSCGVGWRTLQPWASHKPSFCHQKQKKWRVGGGDSPPCAYLDLTHSVRDLCTTPRTPDGEGCTIHRRSCAIKHKLPNLQRLRGPLGTACRVAAARYDRVRASPAVQ